MPETRTTCGTDSSGMIQINNIAHTLHALRAGIALMGRTGVMGKRDEVSGPCENYKSTCKLGSCVNASRRERHTTRDADGRGMTQINDVAHTLRA